MIACGLEMSSMIDTLLEENKEEYALKGDVLIQYQMAIFIFLAMQNHLGDYYPRHGLKLFDITSKSHYLAHSAYQAE